MRIALSLLVIPKKACIEKCSEILENVANPIGNIAMPDLYFTGTDQEQFPNRYLRIPHAIRRWPGVEFWE